jgi:bifunctional DNA-binding transcriptional regulator/antitoxin component of YhaV-PrlF toxin-antitoxin module
MHCAEMIRSTLTNRWQTTIPAEVRRALGLKPRQKLQYEIQGETVVIRSEKSSIMDLAGCLRNEAASGSKEQEREAARQMVIDEYQRSVSDS